MDDESRRPSWPVIGGIAAVAAVAGFGISRWVAPAETSPPAASPAAPEAKGPAEVGIAAAYVASSDIAVESVAAGPIGNEITAPATIAAMPGGEATVVARAAGTISRVARRLGDPVRQGDVLALVDSLEAASMAADRSVASTKADLARRRYEREASLFRQGVTPRQDMESAQAELAVAQAEARRAAAVAGAARVVGGGRSVAVVAPISGRITAEGATLGAYVAPQAELFRIANNGAVQVEASVTASDARRIMAGDKAMILPSEGEAVAATVRSVTPTVSGAAQSATVVLTPSGGSRLLVVGQGVQVRIRARSAGAEGGGMSVPEDAVQNIDGRDVLFVRTAKGFRAQPVLVGQRSGGVAQVISGVRAGDRVATRNAFLVKAEMTKGGEEEE